MEGEEEEKGDKLTLCSGKREIIMAIKMSKKKWGSVYHTKGGRKAQNTRATERTEKKSDRAPQEDAKKVTRSSTQRGEGTEKIKREKSESFRGLSTKEGRKKKR